MVAGAPTTVPASFGSGAAGGSTPAPATGADQSGASPVAKRPTARQTAPVPPAPGRAMTAGELKHCLQQVISQSSMDQQWFSVLHEKISTHAAYIDRLSIKMVGALIDIEAIRGEARKAFDEIEQNDLSIKSLVDGHVQALAARN